MRLINAIPASILSCTTLEPGLKRLINSTERNATKGATKFTYFAPIACCGLIPVRKRTVIMIHKNAAKLASQIVSKPSG